MRHRIVTTILIAVFAAVPTAQAAKNESGDAKELSGMSVLGNNDAPKALYIVPWKSSEIGLAADLTAGLLDDAMAPVDKEVFLRRLQFHEISSGQASNVNSN